MTGRDRRALTIGALVIVAALLAKVMLGGGHRALEVFRGNRHDAQLLELARQEVERLPSLEDSAAVVRAAFIALAPRLLEARTETDAMTELSRILTITTQRTAARLEVITPEADSVRSGDLRRVSMRTRFTADARGLTRTLAILAASSIAVTSEWIQVTAADPFATGEEPLGVELVTSAWYLEASK